MHQHSLRGGRIQFTVDQPLDLNQFKAGTQRTMGGPPVKSSVHSNSNMGGLISGLTNHNSHFGSRGPTMIGAGNHTIPIKKPQNNQSAYQNQDRQEQNQSSMQPNNLMAQRTQHNVEIRKAQLRSGSIGGGPCNVFQSPENADKLISTRLKIHPNAAQNYFTGRKRNQSVHSVGGINIEFKQLQTIAPQAATQGQQRTDYIKELQDQSTQRRRLSHGATIDPPGKLPKLKFENGLSANSLYNNSTLVQNINMSRNGTQHKHSHSQNHQYQHSQATIKVEQFQPHDNKSSISSFIGPRDRAQGVILSGSQFYSGHPQREGFGPDSSSSVYQLYQNRVRPGAEAIFHNDMVHIGGGVGGAGLLSQFDKRHQKHFSSEDGHSETSIPRWHYVGGPGSTSSYLTPGLRYQVQEPIQLTGTSEDLCINIETMSDRSQKQSKFRELPYQRLQIQQAVAAGLPPPTASVLTSFIDTRDLNYGSQGSQQSRHSSSGGQTGFYDQQPYSSSSLPEESEETKSLSKSSQPDREPQQVNVGAGVLQAHPPQPVVKQVQFNIEEPQANLHRIQWQKPQRKFPN
ncbi:hypothetical protein FGO68_gene8204 [Halteria grandinella]|uniref:Uncharacterized protein n=1 Tax=Halteria grandinella TaxID=5974 RepID=A0A8J8P021_HALGN|nr:hypothetical protein FGO68_gene8204 [Halteria grandinella]